MIRYSKGCIFVDRSTVQALLNLIFEDARKPHAVLRLQKGRLDAKTRIYSGPLQPA